MVLPALVHPGVLPTGKHVADLPDLEAVFVRGVSSQTGDRAILLAALRVWLARAKRLLGAGEALMSGSFFGSMEGPLTVRIAFFAERPSLVELALKGGPGLTLFTLGDVIFSEPTGGHVTEFVPVAGLLNAFVADHIDTPLWESLLSSPWSVGVEGVGELGFVSVQV